MNGMIERANEMPNVNNVASDVMDEEDVQALVLSLEQHGIEHPKTKALIRRIEQRVGAERAAELKARAEDKAFGLDKIPPKSQLPASGGTAEAKEKGGAAASGGRTEGKEPLKGRAAFRGTRDADRKSKLPPAAGGGTADASEQAGAAAGGGRGEGKGGR